MDNQTEVISEKSDEFCKANYKLPQRIIDGISGAKRESERNLGVTLTRIFDEWVENGRQSAQDAFRGPEVLDPPGTGALRASKRVLRGVRKVGRQLELLRVDFEGLLRPGSSAATESEARRREMLAQMGTTSTQLERILATTESQLEILDKFERCIAQTEPILGSFGSELTRFRESHMKASKEHVDALLRSVQENFRSLSREVFLLSERYKADEARIKTIQSELVSELERTKNNTKEILDSGRNEIKYYIEKVIPEVKQIKTEFAKVASSMKIKLYIFIAVPFLFLCVGLALIKFYNPVIERFRSDAFVEESIKPIIQQHVAQALVDQKEYFKNLSADNEEMFRTIYAEEGKRIEAAVSKYREESAKAHAEKAISDKRASDALALVQPLKSENGSLKLANEKLSKRVVGDIGLGDWYDSSPITVFSVFLSLAIICLFIGAMFSRRFS